MTIDGVGNPAEADAVLDRVELTATGLAITMPGEMCLLGPYRLFCGDARSMEDVAKVCGGEEAVLLFTDPPYNVPIDGHVSGLGKVKHREFAVASGEMDEASFTAFLTDSLKAAASKLKDGAIATRSSGGLSGSWVRRFAISRQARPLPSGRSQSGSETLPLPLPLTFFQLKEQSNDQQEAPFD